MQEAVAGCTAVMTLWYIQTRIHGIQEDSRCSVSPLEYLTEFLWVLSKVAVSGKLLGVFWGHLPPSAIAVENYLC